MSSPASKVKIAVIGAGLIGPRHAQTVLDTDHCILTAIVDPATAGIQFAASISKPHYHSVAELLRSPDRPDGAIVCTPNHTHVAIAAELLKAGIHVLVEKPISTDVESGRELIEMEGKIGLSLVVGHHRRFNSYVSAAKAIIQSEKLGPITGVNGLWMAYKPLSYFTSALWRQGTDGGVLLINMIHEIDILQYLLGRIVRVYAEKTISRRGFNAEEGAAITLRFESGCVGTFLMSDHAPSPYSFEAGTGENPLIPPTREDFLHIFGTVGCLDVPSMKIWSYQDRQEKSWHSELSTETHDDVNVQTPFALQLRNFVDVIRGDDKPRCTGRDGLSAVMVCEALKKSLETEQPVIVSVI